MSIDSEIVVFIGFLKGVLKDIDTEYVFREIIVETS